MSAAAVEPAPALPDYLTDPNAVLKDTAQWRFGQAPDYSKTRSEWEQTKTTTHSATSLPSLVQNLVKNWEIEASFKSDIADWRTIDRPRYSFAINGGAPQSAEHMLQVGTYNAIISAPNEYYSPRTSDFATSHKTFKRMMPTFAWEVLEVYSGPPQVAFRWRHWGQMKNDYVGFNDQNEKVTAPAHGRMIDIQGVTVATVNDKVQLQKVETWFDPLEMFRQIAPGGIANKLPVQVDDEVPTTKADSGAEDQEGTSNNQNLSPPSSDRIPTEPLPSLLEKTQGDGLQQQQQKLHPPIVGSACPLLQAPAKEDDIRPIDNSAAPPPASHPTPGPKEGQGEALAVPEGTHETAQAREEMSSITLDERRGFMNRE